MRPIPALLSNTVDVFTILAFLTTSLYPSRALAFLNEIELTHQQLIFIRDESLRDRAVVGIEVFPEHQKTVGDAISQDSFTVRTNLITGSVVRVLSTAYSSTVGQTDSSPFITAAGTQVASGTIAANFLPFGTQVRIGGYTYTVWDRMNKRYDDKYIIDIWKPTYEAARAHGVRVLEMEIISLPQQ